MNKKVSLKVITALLNSNPDGIVVLDMEGHPWVWNDRYLQIWHLDQTRMETLTLEQLSEEVRSQLESSDVFRQTVPNKVLDTDKTAETHFRTLDGRWMRRRTYDFVVDGRKQGVVVHWADVTETHELRLAAEHEHELLISLIDNVPDQIYFKDAESRFVRINPSLAQRYGLTDPVEAIGRTDSDFYSAEHAARTREDERRIMRTGEGVFNQLHHEKWADGQHSWNLSTKLPLRDPNGAIIGTFGISHDITEHKERESLIWQQANFDLLTGLPNRRNLRSRWEQSRALTERSKSKLALMLLDLDHFKEVNDTLGHACGDELIKEVASRLKQVLRESDVVARLGGDEFAIVLGNLFQQILAAEIAQKILSVLVEPFKIDGETVFVTASIGIALYPDDGKELDDLFKYADQAMYHAKRQGRNRFSFYTANLEAEAQRKMRLSADLRAALHTEQLYLVYQPIVSLSDSQVVGAEVLLRWRHPTLGAISPAEFVPVAEASGWISELGDWVITEATRQLAVWRQSLYSQMRLAINKSPMQMARPEEQSLKIEALLASAGLPGDAITVEITEGVLLQPSERVHARLREFHQAGVKLAIDDFGTGYSALSYLLQYDIQVLKIDKVFVQGLADAERSRALARAVIGMATALGLDVVAEGIETDEQLELLKGMGCGYGQGFLLGKPMEVPVFEQWLRERQA